MNKGTLLFLSGVTSSGKTSIVNEIQSRKGQLFYALSYDLFEETIPDWAEDDDCRYAQAIIALYAAARAFSDQGQHVLIDGLIMNIDGLDSHYRQLQKIFSGYPLKIINVFCPLAVCRERNRARPDRKENQSDLQAARMETDIDYALTLNTADCAARECADRVLALLP